MNPQRPVRERIREHHSRDPTLKRRNQVCHGTSQAPFRIVIGIPNDTVRANGRRCEVEGQQDIGIGEVRRRPLKERNTQGSTWVGPERSQERPVIRFLVDSGFLTCEKFLEGCNWRRNLVGRIGWKDGSVGRIGRNLVGRVGSVGAHLKKGL